MGELYYWVAVVLIIVGAVVWFGDVARRRVMRKAKVARYAILAAVLSFTGAVLGFVSGPRGPWPVGVIVGVCAVILVTVNARRQRD